MNAAEKNIIISSYVEFVNGHLRFMVAWTDYSNSHPTGLRLKLTTSC